MSPFIRLFMSSCVFLAGCGPKASDVNIQATWGRNLSELGITPIYPPSEDLFVGDIQLLIPNPCDTGAISNQPQSILIGSIPMADIQAAIEQYYDQRPQLPSTSKPPSNTTPTKGAVQPAASKVSITTPGSATVSVAPTGQASTTTAAASSSSSPPVPAQPTADAKTPIFPNGKKGSPMARFRLVAFPDFSYSDFAAGGIGATIPIHGVNVTAGADKQSSRQNDVSVNQVEEAMLPAPVMLRLISDYLHGLHRSDILNKPNVSFLKSLYEQQMISNLGCSQPGQHSSKPAYVVFITRVVAAQPIPIATS